MCQYTSFIFSIVACGKKETKKKNGIRRLEEKRSTAYHEVLKDNLCLHKNWLKRRSFS